MIPSPFETGNREDNFIADLQQLCDKYGYSNYFLYYAEPDGNGDHWHCIGAQITDGLIEIIEETAEELRNQFQ